MQVQFDIDISIAVRYLDKQLSAGDLLAALLREELRRIRRCFCFSEAETFLPKTIDDLSSSIGLAADQAQAASRSAMLYIRNRMTAESDSIFIVEGDAVGDVPSAMTASEHWFVAFPSKSGVWNPPSFSTRTPAYATFCYELSARCSEESLQSVLRNARRYPLVAAHGRTPPAWASSAGPSQRGFAFLEQISKSATFMLADAFDGEVELIVELS